MNNTIYNDVKNIYIFIIKNYISFSIGVFIFLFVLLLVSILSLKFISQKLIVELKIPNKSFEINKFVKYPLHLNIQQKKKKYNLIIKSNFLNYYVVRDNSDPLIKDFIKEKIYSNNQYKLNSIAFNPGKPKKNLVLIIEKKFFSNTNNLLKKISEGIIYNWDDYKKNFYENLHPRTKDMIKIVETDASYFQYISVSKLKINYFYIFLIFLFIMFNVVSIIVIKEIKNDNIK